MYRHSYAEVLEDDCASARASERLALETSIGLLRAAEKKGAGSGEAAQALLFVERLWTIFIEDLGSAANDLPKQLRADLISIGLWMLRETEQIRGRKSENFKGLIEVSAGIVAGLQ
jgi:flagellar protein FlaF